MFIALDKLHNQGIKQAIITVPEPMIGRSFSNAQLTEHGFWADWEVPAKRNLCDAPLTDGGKIDSIGEYLNSDDKVLLCTHASFRFAVERFGIEVFDGRLIAIDEFHHVAANESNKLDSLLAQIMKRNKPNIVAMTARDLLPRAAAFNEERGRPPSPTSANPIERMMADAVSVRAGPLFSDKIEEGDIPSGTIYVLRSKSNLPYIVKNRPFVHKIGVTHADIHKRIANAHLQPTFLMAGVEVVATYDLYHISSKVPERIIHTVFDIAQIDIKVKDRFGRCAKPQEWLRVPRPVIDFTVEKIKEGTVGKYIYDNDSETLQLRK